MKGGTVMVERFNRRIGGITENMEAHLKKLCSKSGTFLIIFTVLACAIRLGCDNNGPQCLKLLLDGIVLLLTWIF